MSAKENIHVTPDIAIGDGIAVDPDYKGKALRVEFTVDDPEVSNTPWSATLTYSRALSPWLERVCAENTREYYADKDTAVPHADKPDF